MRRLLDACSFVWFVSDPDRLSPLAADRVTDPAVRLYLSVTSVWEVLVKQRTGRPDAPQGDVLAAVSFHVRRGHLELLPLTLAHVARAPLLPDVHRDPWDRMLVCQAQAERLTILTPDKLIHQYPVAWEW